MKTSRTTFLLLLFAVPVFITGCQKSELTDNRVEKTTPAFCGTPMITNIYELGQTASGVQGTTSYGTVTISNDNDNLYVKYDLIDGWEINYEGSDWRKGAHLFVGSQAQLTATSWRVEFLTSNTVHLVEDLLPYAYVPAGPGVNVYTFVIPRNQISVACPYIVAIVDIRNSETGEVKPDLSARSNTKCYAYYFQYCMQTCGNCETGYAKGDDPNSNCFLTLPGVNSNNWGWSNLVTAPGTYYWPIWAGAGQCNTSNGTESGKLKVVFDGTSVTVTYMMYGGFGLTETHLWVGKDYLPKKNGKYVTAPGQFGNNHGGLNGAANDTFGPMIMTAPFYIAAHCGVCW